MIRINLAPVWLKTSSHRSRSRITAYVGRSPQYYWTWQTAGCLLMATVRQWQKIKLHGGVTGVTLWRPKTWDKPGRCWK